MIIGRKAHFWVLGFKTMSLFYVKLHKQTDILFFTCLIPIKVVYSIFTLSYFLGLWFFETLGE